jgi:hypothetical protein
MKLGHPLREISSFPGELVARLRDEFSVTTAEEFVGLWRAARKNLEEALGDAEQTEVLVRKAMESLSPTELQAIVEAERRSYPFATGHDPPPDGRKTY